jgi:hypothetical protein
LLVPIINIRITKSFKERYQIANEIIISIPGTPYLFPNGDPKEAKKKAREEKGKKVEMGDILLFEDNPINNTILY